MKIILTASVIFFCLSLNAQNDRSAILQDLEKGQSSRQVINATATVKSATRLFGDKNDLTTVIMIIPAGSVVDVLGADSTYLNVAFQDTVGFIYRRHAELTQVEPVQKPVVNEVKPSSQARPETSGEQQQNRFTYLENKYGSSMAAKLMSGKIWKGMDSEMVSDSWGTPKKINRVISGNIVKEEWIYNSTWLYIENDRLADWGPIR